MLDQKQIRAARGLIDWTQETLAERSGVARATIKNVESGATLPRLETANALQRAFEEAGVEFLPSSGVRMRDRIIQIFEGNDANRRVEEDAYMTLRDTGGDLFIAHTDEQLAIDDLGKDYLFEMIRKRRAANIKQHLLVRADDPALIPPLDTYRILPDENFSPYPFYIYGPKLALVRRQAPQKAVIINDEHLVDGVRRLFKFVWDRTEMPSYKNIKKT